MASHPRAHHRFASDEGTDNNNNSNYSKIDLATILDYYPYHGAHGLHALLTKRGHQFSRGKSIVLHVFDFDGTLFKSPMPSRTLWTSATPMIIQDLQWFQDARTLHPPLVPPKPTEAWFISDVIEAVRKACRRRKRDQVRHHIVCLMTGRRHDHFYQRIQEMLPRDLQFDLFICKEPSQPEKKSFATTEKKYNDHDTWGFKMRFIETIHHFLPSIRMIHIWDDRQSQIQQFQTELHEWKESGKIGHFQVHPISHPPPSPAPTFELEGFRQSLPGCLTPSQEIQLVKTMVALHAEQENQSRRFDFQLQMQPLLFGLFLHPDSTAHLKRLFPIPVQFSHLSGKKEASKWIFSATHVPILLNPSSSSSANDYATKMQLYQSNDIQELMATHVGLSSTVLALKIHWPKHPELNSLHLILAHTCPDTSSMTDQIATDSIQQWYELSPQLTFAAVTSEKKDIQLRRQENKLFEKLKNNHHSFEQPLTSSHGGNGGGTGGEEPMSLANTKLKYSSTSSQEFLSPMSFQNQPSLPLKKKNTNSGNQPSHHRHGQDDMSSHVTSNVDRMSDHHNSQMHQNNSDNERDDDDFLDRSSIEETNSDMNEDDDEDLSWRPLSAQIEERLSKLF